MYKHLSLTRFLKHCFYISLGCSLLAHLFFHLGWNSDAWSTPSYRDVDTHLLYAPSPYLSFSDLNLRYPFLKIEGLKRIEKKSFAYGSIYFLDPFDDPQSLPMHSITPQEHIQTTLIKTSSPFLELSIPWQFQKIQGDSLIFQHLNAEGQWEERELEGTSISSSTICCYHKTQHISPWDEAFFLKDQSSWLSWKGFSYKHTLRSFIQITYTAWDHKNQKRVSTVYGKAIGDPHIIWSKKCPAHLACKPPLTSWDALKGIGKKPHSLPSERIKYEEYKEKALKLWTPHFDKGFVDVPL